MDLKYFDVKSLVFIDENGLQYQIVEDHHLIIGQCIRRNGGFYIYVQLPINSGILDHFNDISKCRSISGTGFVAADKDVPGFEVEFDFNDVLVTGSVVDTEVNISIQLSEEVGKGSVRKK